MRLFLPCVPPPSTHVVPSLPPCLGGSMSSQSLKNLTIFKNFAQILHTNSHPREKQLCQILEESVSIFRATALPKWNLTPKIGLDRYVASILINNSSNNWARNLSDTFLERSHQTLFITPPISLPPLPILSPHPPPPSPPSPGCNFLLIHGMRLYSVRSNS